MKSRHLVRNEAKKRLSNFICEQIHPLNLSLLETIALLTEEAWSMASRNARAQRARRCDHDQDNDAGEPASAGLSCTCED